MIIRRTKIHHFLLQGRNVYDKNMADKKKHLDMYTMIIRSTKMHNFLLQGCNVYNKNMVDKKTDKILFGPVHN